MFTKLVCFVILVSPISAAVTWNNTISCSPKEFVCGDGGCVSEELVCDGSTDCADGLDEISCKKSPFSPFDSERVRRQVSVCRSGQFGCRDGSCISFDGKCDGVVDCADGSDEAHYLCRKITCQENWFRCTYGACVDGSAPCNGRQECADNSDELLPRCRSEPDEVRGNFNCLDGSTIPATSHCDGMKDCADGSDETVRSCAAKTCASYVFQCAYGACVDSDASCNGRQDCADGSDEAPELCNKTSVAVITVEKRIQKTCILPQYPDHGVYTVSNSLGARPGESLNYAILDIRCYEGYVVNGRRGPTSITTTTIYCANGDWPEKMPQCVLPCRLTPHVSVEYQCIDTVNGRDQYRYCNEYEPAGTRAKVSCRQYYYDTAGLKDTVCEDGKWDKYQQCNPDCGTVISNSNQLISNGTSAEVGEVPWHAGIYEKIDGSFSVVCGGSIVSATVVISAAHCFWDKELRKKKPASNYEVVLGKIYRPYNSESEDKHYKPEYFKVESINLPEEYQGKISHHQADIAIVRLSTLISYREHIRPVCLDYNNKIFEESQLKPKSKGKVAGWGLVSEHGKLNRKLQVVKLPFIPLATCRDSVPETFVQELTLDKFCAGFQNASTSVCHGDSGGGLAFPTPDKGVLRYFLRGVVSSAPAGDFECNTNTYTSFTRVSKHESFIRQYLRD